jgi:hypothetical protein
MGRPPKAEPSVKWSVRIPASLAARWDLILMDPLLGKILPNARQTLIVPLLQRIWDAASRGDSTITISDISARIHRSLEPQDDEDF